MTSSRMSGESTAAMIQPTVFRSLSLVRTLAAILAAAAAEIDKGEAPFHYLVLYGILRLKNELTDISESDAEGCLNNFAECHL
jgi:hypothetical protein